MVDAGAVPLLVLCVQEPEISVKRIAASALSDIAKHSPEVCIYCTKDLVMYRVLVSCSLLKQWLTPEQ